MVGFVRLPHSGKSVLDDILADTRAWLADYKVPEWLQIVDEIPRNALGKIDRKSLLAMTSDPHFAAAADLRRPVQHPKQVLPQLTWQAVSGWRSVG